MDASTEHMEAIHDDVAEFALLLRRLKERTDRSYAALARRLGVNASTLHRYCAGEAVPLDFTGIERFAALCGASPEERVELHRRWILAVAARRRSRTSEVRRAPMPHATTSTAAPAVSASHSSASAEAPEPASHADARPGSASPDGRRRALRSITLAALFAVALAGLATSAAGPRSGAGGSSASARITPTPPAQAARSDGSPLPADGRPSGAGESTAPARPTPKPSAPATPGGGGQQRNRASTGTVPPAAPLTWTADSHLWRLECDHDYVIDKSPQQVPPPPTPADAAGWATSQQAVHGRTTDLRITVQGRGSAAVVLEALHVRVVNRTVPAVRRGIAYSMYEGCGAVLIPRYFSVNLDAPRALARPMSGNEPGRPTTVVGFPYRVFLREPEILLLSARTQSCTCEWYVDLDWSSQGRTGTMRIDDHGHPFRTTSIEGLPHYWYRNPSGWVPMTTVYDESETAD